MRRRAGRPWALTAVTLTSLVGSAARGQPLRVVAPEDGCPRRRQLIAALEARIPGSTGAGAPGTPTRRVQLEPSAAEGASLRLLDERGAVVLERHLGGESAGAGGAAA